MNKTKLSYKMYISIILVTLFCMYLFEFMYSRHIMKEYSNIHNEIEEIQNRVDMLIEIDSKMQKYILNEIY